MRHASLIAAIILTGACAPVMGQFLAAADDPMSIPAQSQAQIRFTQTEIDFGKIGDDARQEFEFRFQNTGGQPLTIFEATGSCGCTVPQLPKNTYEPGEAGTIKVIFNPANRRGAQHQFITVRTSDPAQQVVRLGVRADIQPRVIVEPQSIAFGFVPKGAGPTMEVAVAGINENFEVTKASMKLLDLPESMRDTLPTWDPNKVFTVSLGERSERMVGQKKYYEQIVKVTLSKDAPIGLLRNVRLSIEHNDPIAKSLDLPVMATQLGDITMTPPRMSLGRLQPGDKIDQQVIVRTSSGQPFEITSIEHTNNAGDSVTHHIEPIADSNGAAYRLFIRSESVQANGALRGTLRLHTNVPDEEVIEYSYVGAVVSGQATQMVPTQVTPAARTVQPQGTR